MAAGTEVDLSFKGEAGQGEYASPTGTLERTRGPSGSGGINLEKLARDMQVLPPVGLHLSCFRGRVQNERIGFPVGASESGGRSTRRDGHHKSHVLVGHLRD